MNKINKYLLLTQMRTFRSAIIVIGIIIISILFLESNLLLLIIPITLCIMVRFIEEKMGYSYYQEELAKERRTSEGLGNGGEK